MSLPPSKNSDPRLSIAEQLRFVAEQLIQDKTKSIDQTLTTHLSSDVLALLYKSINSLQGSSHALKLLHEFQVHQVELDLQFKQFESTEQELNKVIAYYQSLFHFAPIAYLVTCNKGQIQDGNMAASQLLGIEKAELCSSSIYDFLSERDKSLIRQKLKTLKQGTDRVQCEVTLNCHQQDPHKCMIIANHRPSGTSIQMLLFEGVLSHT